MEKKRVEEKKRRGDTNKKSDESGGIGEKGDRSDAKAHLELTRKDMDFRAKNELERP